MAQEIRKIEFDLMETYVALQIFCKKTGKTLPGSEVSSAKSSTTAPGQLEIQFDNDDNKKIRLRDKDMLTALLVFCQEKNIPVPKGGKKMIKGESEKVVLLVKM